ncbi:MAG: hypothetical protein LUF04_02010 [Bacteroides sp.]|nr:hypothetical protein [Bacteroides sp.]
MSLKKHGKTTETVKRILLNAGVIYKNLTYDETDGWNGTALGATSGGIKFNWEATWLDVEVDGATVLVKGLTKQKVGESASIEGAMTEAAEDILVTAMHLEEDTSDDANYTKYITKSNVTEDDDYLDNIAYIGNMSGGTNIIIILPNAICTEAFELETKNAEQATFNVKFECTADLANDTLDKLDIEIYYPTATA